MSCFHPHSVPTTIEVSAKPASRRSDRHRQPWPRPRPGLWPFFANDTVKRCRQSTSNDRAGLDHSALQSDPSFLKSISHTAQMQQAAAVLHALGLSPKEAEYIQAMTSLSPVEAGSCLRRPRRSARCPRAQPAGQAVRHGDHIDELASRLLRSVARRDARLPRAQPAGQEVRHRDHPADEGRAGRRLRPVKALHAGNGRARSSGARPFRR